MPGREKFGELLRMVEKGRANGLLAWHPDRLARNSMDGGKIVYFLDTGKLVDLKFPTFWFENTPQGKFMLSIAFGQSKYYVDNLSENVRRGQRQKLRNGVWPAKAPYGYNNNPRTRNIDVDPETSVAVKKAFELFSQGNTSYIDISRFLYTCGMKRRNGKMLHINEIRIMLTNRFYIGIMKYSGEYYDGKHECFISKELFDEVQKHVKRISKTHNGHDFPFIGFARCGDCGAAITAESHTKHYKTTNRTAIYHYYRCTRKLKPCNQKPVTESSMESQLRIILSECVLPSTWAAQWLQWLEQDEIEETQSSGINVQRLQAELAAIEKKVNILLDSYLDQIIDAETYKQKKNELFELKLKLQEEIGKVQTQGSSWIEPMREFILTASQLEKIARAKNNPEELRFFGKRIGANFFLKDRRLAADFVRGFAALRAPPPARRLADFPASSSFSVE